MTLKKLVLMILGFIGVVLSAVGAVVPLLPAFPFLLFAAFCFAKSSEQLHLWFTATKLYQNNLESFVHVKGMTIKTKCRIIAIVTATMMIGFIMMNGILAGRITLFAVWVFHILYIFLGIRTIPHHVAELTHCKNIEIEGMRCKRCAKKLECELNKDRRIYAAVNFKESLATIRMEKEVQNQLIFDIIHQAGYRVK